MPETFTVRIPPLQVIYHDVFVLQPLYRVMRKWIIENEYKDPVDSSDEELQSGMETLYLERRGTANKPNEKEWRIWWRTVKPVAMGGRSRYFTYHLDIDWNVIFGVDMEIMRDGKKMRVQHGEIRFDIRPYLTVPSLSSLPLLKFVDYFFRTRMMAKNVEEHKKLLYQDAYRLQNMIKKYLEMKSFMPAEEPFHEKYEFI